MKLCLIAVVALSATACTPSPGRARETLESQGFTDIQLGGYAPFSCSDSDSLSTSFTAKNANGRMVSGTVCCGILKSCTVRW